ncbi:diguanylate cyclase [Nodosilinea sp. LEGE 06152]|uniref:diguanylate cyclase domain-containing protein n=1 Tax=Nodosilinea sp. LEGE 06152 TaxID=2777966 RepID=UPI001882A4AE|nr:diguanylate cyclase [Nodosilinea sp. LEGE 06152]MBE9158711.1 diguanylate cyclase [Nodosilinea sp. LEGE 06152]
MWFVEWLHYFKHRFSRVPSRRQLQAQVEAYQQTLQSREKQQQSLYRVISKIRASLDLDVIFQTTTKETCKLLRTDRIAVYRFDDNWGGEFVHDFEFSEPSWDEVWDQKTVWDDTYLQDHKGGRYARNEPFFIDDVHNCTLSQCHLDILIQYHINSFATAPIFVGQKLWGILGAYQHFGPRHWTELEIQFLSQVATQLGFAVKQANLLAQAHQKAQEIQAISDQQEILLNLIAEIRESLDLDVLFKTTVKEVRKVLRTDRVGIFQFEAGSHYCTGEFVAENVLPEYDSAIAVRIQDRCFGERYAVNYQKGRMQVLSDVYSANLSDCHISILEKFQVKAQIIIPLTQRGVLWGLLCIHQCRGPRDWIASDLQFVRQLAAQFTVALEHASMLAQIKSQADQLTQTVRSLEVVNSQLEQLSHLDALTQVPNRRYFNSKLEQEWTRLQRNQQPLALIMIDVDYFKRFNDGFGHLAGDRCLQSIAQAVKDVLQRPVDELCRYGGEEFAVILPETDHQGATHIVRNIQQAVQKLAISVPEPFPPPTPFVTVSLGIAVQVPNSESTIHNLIDQADEALYIAKRKGRNTWVVYAEKSR